MQMTTDQAGDVARWRDALNPPIYLVSVLPGLGVPLLAGGDRIAVAALLLATFAVVLLQHAINLFNDAADWRLGADVDKRDSWVRVHDGRTRPVVLHAIVSLVTGGLLGLYVLWQQDRWWILPAAAPLLVLGYLYNAGPRPLSYTHFGEWVTGLCYGPGVFGGLWLVAGLAPDARMLAGMAAFAALAMALLLSHQPPQIETDRAAGKRSFAVRYGADTTRRTARALFLLFIAALAVGALVSLRSPTALVFVALGVFVTLRLYLGEVNPKRILASASFVVAGGVALAIGWSS